MRTAPLALCALFLLAACTDATSPDDLGVGDLSASVMTQTYLPPEARPSSHEERMAMHRASKAALADAQEILRTSATWQEADRRFRARLASTTDPLYRQQLGQIAATRMLDAQVLGAVDGDEALDAVGYYVDRLVEGNSVNVDRIADGLERLRGHWTPAKISAVADRALATGTAFAASRAACDGCSLDDLGRVVAAEHRGEQAVYEVELVATLGRLDALATTAR